MELGSIVVISIAMFGTMFIFAGTSIYNGIIRNKNSAKRAWSDVIAWQVNKLKVIPELARGVQDYKEFEQSTLTKVTELRSSIAGLSKDKIDVSQLAKVEALSQQLLSGLKVTVEAYPQLKASDLYLKWMKELSEIQENITAALGVYNRNVEEFNNGIQTFPASMINGMFNKEVALEIFSDTAAAQELEYKPNF